MSATVFSILSAPKDGTPILAFNSDMSIVEVIRWRKGTERLKDGAVIFDQEYQGWAEPGWDEAEWAMEVPPAGWVPVSAEVVELIKREWGGSPPYRLS